MILLVLGYISGYQQETQFRTIKCCVGPEWTCYWSLVRDSRVIPNPPTVNVINPQGYPAKLCKHCKIKAVFGKGSEK